MMSVFTDPSSSFVFGGNSGRVLAGGGVEVVFHGAVGRSKGPNAWDSPLSAHPIILCEEELDTQEEEGEVTPRSTHKLGGKPYLVQRGGSLEEEVRALESAGYRQALQIDFPGQQDALLSDPWPFGTGIFHVLIRRTDAGYEWRCFWEK